MLTITFNDEDVITILRRFGGACQSESERKVCDKIRRAEMKEATVEEQPRWLEWRFGCNTCQKTATKHFEGVGRFLIRPTVVCEICGSDSTVEMISKT